MRILHCCLSCFYIEGYNYQENVLPRQNKFDGHEVKIIASTETFVDNRALGYVSPCSYVNSDGIEVVRLPYSNLLINFAKRKVRKYQGSFEMIRCFKPDVILFHGTGAWDLLHVARYKKENPHVKLYVDSHEDANNSARNFLSKNVLHKLLYKNILKRAYRWIDKILYISMDAKDFLNTIYKLPDEKLEFYPLGGVVFDTSERAQRRERIRESLRMRENDILVIHSGKMDALKRTEDLLKALSTVADPRLRLILIGSMTDGVKSVVEPMIQEDKRVEYIGWKSADELMDYLCACDLYAQPGSQSATAQNAICCGAPVMLANVKSHKPLVQGNGFLVDTIEEMVQCFQQIVKNKEQLAVMSKNSYRVAYELLDYRKLAARLYE